MNQNNDQKESLQKKEPTFLKKEPTNKSSFYNNCVKKQHKETIIFLLVYFGILVVVLLILGAILGVYRKQIDENNETNEFLERYCNSKSLKNNVKAFNQFLEKFDELTKIVEELKQNEIQEIFPEYQLPNHKTIHRVNEMEKNEDKKEEIYKDLLDGNRNAKQQKKKEQEKEQEKEKEKKVKILPIKSYETFQPEFSDKGIELSNNDQTASNLEKKNSKLRVCGKNSYSVGVHEILVKIDKFVKTEEELNWVQLGVIDSNTKKDCFSNNKNDECKGTYSYVSYWNGYYNVFASQKQKVHPKLFLKEENGYGKPFKQDDQIKVILDMDKKTLSFKVNNQNFGQAWDNLPDQVYFFVGLLGQTNEPNRVTLLNDKLS
ncbi:spry domain-containing socs box protein [Anaeramoeba flamelloides]|uniref:Spry domain-containing socs box protein n=1 Tax=Anaeramoeba flamelloides TaxID=1746091 RepID=A0AAV8ABC1_9EUKA|nr:spry domain-containing socs box protein [Anaeramoeba flamelloides]